MGISIIKFNELSPEQREYFSVRAERDFVIIGNARNGNELVKYLEEKEHKWFITIDDDYAGIIAIHPSDKNPLNLRRKNPKYKIQKNTQITQDTLPELEDLSLVNPVETSKFNHDFDKRFEKELEILENSDTFVIDVITSDQLEDYKKTKKEIPPEDVEVYSTTTYIFSEYRGLKINKFLKQIISQVFLRHPEYKLISVIQDWNTNSIAAMQKVFPKIKPIKVVRPKRERVFESELHCYIYDLSKVSYQEIDDEYKHIFEKLEEWM